MRKLLKFYFYFAGLCIILFFIAFFALNTILQKNGITYLDKSFRFPLSLEIKGIQIKQPNLSARIDELEVNLSLKSIFKGKLYGENLMVRNAHIQLISSDFSKKQTDTIDFPTSIPIHFQRISLQNIDFKHINSNDTISLNLPELTSSDVNLTESYHIDSLMIRGISIAYNQQNQAIKAVNESDETSSKSFPVDFPVFNINSLKFLDGSFKFNHPEQHQTIKNFNIELSGLKNNDLLNVSVSRLSFCYQDTLDVKLSLGKLSINNQEEIKIQHLNITLPWLKLNIPQLELSNLHSPHLHALIQDSYVNTALVRYFFPSIKLPISNDLNLNADGAVSYTDGRIGFDKMALQFDNVASLHLDGFTDFPDKENSSIQLNISNFNTSYSKISHLLDLPESKEQKEIAITTDILLSGTYSKLKAEGIFHLNKIAADFSAVLEQNENKKMSLSASLNSRYIDPAQLLHYPDGEVKLYNVQLSGKLAIRNQALTSVSLKALGDSIIYDNFHISAADLECNYDQNQTSVQIQISDLLNLTLHSTDNILSERFSFDGSITGHLPQLIDFKQNAGDYYSKFSGYFTNKEKTFDFRMAFDTIQFQAATSVEKYQSTGNIAASRNKEGEINLNLSIDNQEYIRFSGSDNLFEWWNSAEKWNHSWPVAELRLNMDLDSVLVNQLTGLHASVQLKDMHIRSTENTLFANIDMPFAKFDTFIANEILGNFEYSPHSLNSQLTMASFKNPYAFMEKTRLQFDQQENDKLSVSMNSYFPEIQNDIELNAELAYSDTSYIISLDDKKVMRFGNHTWRNQKCKGFEFSPDFELLSGELSIASGKQKINIETNNHMMSFNIDSLNLYQAGMQIFNDTSFRAILSCSGKYNLKERRLQWLVSLSELVLNNKKLGELHTDGYYADSLLNAQLTIDEEYGKLKASILKNTNLFEYQMDIADMDVNYLNSGFSPIAEIMPLTGQINAKLQGSYETDFKSTGYIGFNNLQTYLTDYKIFLNVKNDTLWFKDNQLIAKNCQISDMKGNILHLDGHLTLQKNLQMDLSLKSKDFCILDNDNSSNNLRGKIDIDTDLHILRNLNQFSINGDLSVLPNSNLYYVYQSSVSIDEREKELTFVSFDSIDHPQAGPRKSIVNKKSSNPIQWNVNLEVGKSDVTIILSETAQDQIKMTTDGSFLLKTSDNDRPFFYGTLKSKEGSIIYDAPAVSDLNFTIENLEVNWNGELTDPKITFLGSEIFRVTSKGIPGLNNSNSVVPITVLAKVNERSINDFTLNFDMNSNNPQVKNWIQSLPADTREATAINLLLFGSLNFGEMSGGGSILQSMVGKMNEISRRNIKSADISFYVDNENVSESDVNAKERLGYSLSKDLFDKKVKISVGGSVDLGNNTDPDHKSPFALGNVQLDYLVSKSPEINLFLSQRSTYDGVINGQINESSAGITFQKSFRNFFRIFKKKKAE